MPRIRPSLRLRGKNILLTFPFIEPALKRSRKKVLIRGLNVDHNHDLKNIFKGAALSASIFSGPLQDSYQEQLAAGIKRRWRG
jgi:hypothetical protein